MTLIAVACAACLVMTFRLSRDVQDARNEAKACIAALGVTQGLVKALSESVDSLR